MIDYLKHTRQRRQRVADLRTPVVRRLYGHWSRRAEEFTEFANRIAALLGSWKYIAAGTEDSNWRSTRSIICSSLKRPPLSLNPRKVCVPLAIYKALDTLHVYSRKISTGSVDKMNFQNYFSIPFLRAHLDHSHLVKYAHATDRCPSVLYAATI